MRRGRGGNRRPAPDTRPDFTVYTDGCCLANPGPAGYAAIVLPRDGGLDVISSGFKLSTNNRMELMAVLAAMEAMPDEATVHVWSDSRYVVDGLSKWIWRWQRENWKRIDGGQVFPVMNADLFQRFLVLRERMTFSIYWLKGHEGQTYNEMADVEAAHAAQTKATNEDHGYHQGQAALAEAIAKLEANKGKRGRPPHANRGELPVAHHPQGE